MKKRHTPEQIIRKLRQAEAELASGVSVPEVARRLGISEATFHRWTLARTDQRGDRGIRGIQKVSDLLGHLFLADSSEPKQPRDDHAFAPLPDQRLQRLLEHPLHLTWYAGERGEERTF
jgi:transposase-like protein